MPFQTQPFNLGNTLARASQIQNFRSRNKLNNLRIAEFERIRDQEGQIQNAFASDEPINSLLQLGPQGLEVASALVQLASDTTEQGQKKLQLTIDKGRMANDAINNALTSASPRQSVALAKKRPELADVFRSIDLDAMSDEELVSQLEEAEIVTRLFNEPQELARIIAGPEAEALGGAPDTVFEEKSIGGRVTDFSVLQQVSREEVGQPGEFSGTTSQKFKRREDFRTSVVNTSLAIDKATDLVKFAVAEPGAIGTPGAIFSFGNNFLRTAAAIFTEILPGQDLEVDFGPDDVDFSAFSNGRLRELAASNAQFRAGVFSIAFAAAVAEQGSRPSDKDVEGKIREIAGDSSDVLSFVPTISNFVRNIDSRVRKTGRVGDFQESFLNSVLPELDRSMAAFNEVSQSAPVKESNEARLRRLGF